MNEEAGRAGRSRESMSALVSVVINTLNEESNIAECIRSVRGFADEVVVCDMHSRDRTAAIAVEQGARVVLTDANYCDFGRLRHFAVQQAQYEWVLVLDADERMTADLGEQLLAIAQQDRADVVLLANLYWYFGGWVRHGDFFANTWPRFFRRRTFLERYRDADEALHQDLSMLREVPNRIVLDKDFHLEHYAYPTIEKYVRKTLGSYARVEAEQLLRRGRGFSVVRLIGEPVREFTRRFILRRGFLDGMRGFVLAVLFATYRFTTWANVWLLEQERRRPGSGLSARKLDDE
jgi:glycosyltransferase involved in cell wall biosynthesis